MREGERGGESCACMWHLCPSPSYIPARAPLLVGASPKSLSSDTEQSMASNLLGAMWYFMFWIHQAQHSAATHVSFQI